MMALNRRRVELPGSIGFLLEERARYKCLFGGRGGMKSTSVAMALLLLGAQNKLKILCAREFQNSIKESVHSLLEEQVEALGLRGSFYDVRSTTIVGRNGTEFLFTGLRQHSVTTLKSFHGADICWVEEAEVISEKSWRVLTPTIRRPGSEIWVTFNPAQDDDPTYLRFVANQKDGTTPKPGAIVAEDKSWRSSPDTPAAQRYIVQRVYWWQNKWLSEESKAEAREMRRTDPEAYMHVWEGETWTRSNAQVMHGKWVIDQFVPVTGMVWQNENWGGPYFGADWGFAKDPTVLLKLWIHGRTLYIEHEAYKVGCELDDTPALFDGVPGARSHRIYADNARPETISHIKGKGFDIEPCEKWSGSVEDGIAFLRSFDKIVIHPRCKHTITEARLYSYKTDRLSGNVLPEVLDKHNHCWDAARYGLGPMIQNQGDDAFAHYRR